jgi:thiamine biosynthesis lipoprotein
MSTPGSSHDFEIWTSSGRVVVTDPAALTAAVEIVRDCLDEVEHACSRFRPDSELMRLTGRACLADLAGANPNPTRVRVSPLLADLVGTALAAAASTDGLVDPTLGRALHELGYDRSIEQVPADGAAVRVRRLPSPGWRRIRLDDEVLTLPGDVLLDLGATAKARAADLAAARVADALGVGVLVELGGDVATAGPEGDPSAGDGWQVLVRDTSDDPACQVTLAGGSALATSSTVRRAWRRGGLELHHILDPRTAAPAPPVWRSVTVGACTCVEANTASTAAVVLGHQAPAWLSARGLAARLVDRRHRTVHVGGWPDKAAA